MMEIMMEMMMMMNLDLELMALIPPLQLLPLPLPLPLLAPQHLHHLNSIMAIGPCTDGRWCACLRCLS